MTSIFNLRRTRFTATVMLFIWMMTLGIANACRLHDDAARHDQHVVADAGFRPVVELALEPMACRSIASAGQPAVAKQKVHAPANLDIDTLPVPAWRVANAQSDSSDSLPGSIGPVRREPPAFIRFLRLTL